VWHLKFRNDYMENMEGRVFVACTCRESVCVRYGYSETRGGHLRVQEVQYVPRSAWVKADTVFTHALRDTFCTPCTLQVPTSGFSETSEETGWYGRAHAPRAVSIRQISSRALHNTRTAPQAVRCTDESEEGRGGACRF
jgi:hypothetical protein